MSTHRITMINWGNLPKVVAGGAYFTRYSAINSGTLLDRMVLVMPSGVESGIEGSFEIPENYVDTPILKKVWTSETAAGDVDFQLDHRTIDGSDTELFDTITSPAQRTNSSNGNTGPTVVSRRMVDTFSLTATDFVAGATVHFEFLRNGDIDTKAAAITVWALEFKYNDA